MVQNTGETRRPGSIRPLRAPLELRVITAEGNIPEAMVVGGSRLHVAAIQDRWRIDDEWWRPNTVSRAYYQLTLEDGRTLTVFNDLISSRWYQQSYA